MFRGVDNTKWRLKTSSFFFFFLNAGFPFNIQLAISTEQQVIQDKNTFTMKNPKNTPKLGIDD